MCCVKYMYFQISKEVSRIITIKRHLSLKFIKVSEMYKNTITKKWLIYKWKVYLALLFQVHMLWKIL